MEIKYFSGKTVVIKGKKETVLVDPKKENLDDAKIASRVVVYTSDGFDYWEPENGERVVIRGPGEYEVGGMEIAGYKGGGEGNTIYTVLVEGVTVGILGAMKEVLTDKKVERVNAMDVMLVSIGGENKVAYKSMIDLAKKWGVNYLIPINYNDEELKKFLDETDNEGSEPTDGLKVDKDSLPDGLEVAVLKNGRNN
jgi:L-ascorbate metabolism protein UlaG (beta-lactamase superfamily)